MKIDEFVYKGYKVEITYSKQVKMFYTKSIIGFTSNHKNIDNAIKEHEKLIDNFINININSYEELAKKIIESIVFTDFKEECYIEESILQHLVESFIKNKSINLKKK